MTEGAQGRPALTPIQRVIVAVDGALGENFPAMDRDGRWMCGEIVRLIVERQSKRCDRDEEAAA